MKYSTSLFLAALVSSASAQSSIQSLSAPDPISFAKPGAVFSSGSGGFGVGFPTGTGIPSRFAPSGSPFPLGPHPSGSLSRSETPPFPTDLASKVAHQARAGAPFRSSRPSGGVFPSSGFGFPSGASGTGSRKLTVSPFGTGSSTGFATIPTGITTFKTSVLPTPRA
jgi:hypothetical protein